jgi:hypothetical protein
MASAEDDTLAIVGLLIAMKSKNTSKNKRKIWCKEWFQKKETHIPMQISTKKLL